jgi:hypothetical protein
MSWLPRGTSLGQLRAEETFVFYDGPRVFSCRSLTDQWFIAAWADEGQSYDLWLYVAVSSARLSMVKSGGLLLRDAFLQPEGSLYLVTIHHDESVEDTVETIEPETLDEALLPGPSFRLELPTHTLQPAEDGAAIQRKAIQEGRARLRIKINMRNHTRTEAPARKIGQILVATQGVYDNIGAILLDANAPQRGQIPAEIRRETACEVLNLSAASFVIEIGAIRGYDLFDESVFSRISRRLLDLFDNNVDRSGLVRNLDSLRPRAAKSFRNFVKDLANAGGDVTIGAAGANFNYTQRELSTEMLQNLVRLLNNLLPEGTIEIQGRMRLYRLDTDRRLFGLKDEGEDIRYEGNIAERATPQVQHATVNDFYDVSIIAHNILDEAVGERKPRYVLEQLAPAAGGPLLTEITMLEVSDDITPPPF